MNKIFAMVQTKSNFRNLNGRILEVTDMHETRVTCKCEIDGITIHVDFNLNEITGFYNTGQSNNSMVKESTQCMTTIGLTNAQIETLLDALIYATTKMKRDNETDADEIADVQQLRKNIKSQALSHTLIAQLKKRK